MQMLLRLEIKKTNLVTNVKLSRKINNSTKMPYILKRVRDRIIKYSQIHRTDKYT